MFPELGRGGGIVSVLLGAVVSASGYYFSRESGGGIAYGTLALGLYFILMGVVAFRSAQKTRLPDTKVPIDSFLEDLRTRDLGFWVCTRCRTVMPFNYGGACLECGRGVDCLEVQDEPGRAIAISAAGV